VEVVSALGDDRLFVVFVVSVDLGHAHGADYTVRKLLRWLAEILERNTLASRRHAIIQLIDDIIKLP
jgi:hypothetical protein